MPGNRRTFIFVIMLTCQVSWMAYAEEARTTGLKIVPDTATAVVNKATALLDGSLECTMTIGKDKHRDDYTTDPLGRRIPRGTLKKYDSGVR